MYARVLLVAATLTLPCAAQNVISAKSGTLHYFTGQVSIDGVDKQMKPGVFPMVKPDSTLRTEVGQAEVLLTPGVFLRLNYHSAIRMLDADLEKTRVEVIAGSVMVEADDPRLSVKNAPVSLLLGSAEIRLVKYGLVRISAEENLIKVYRGEVEVTAQSAKLLLKTGQRSTLSGELKAEKFAVRNESDELMVWSAQRSADLSAANLLAAGTVRSGRGYRSDSDPSWAGGWFYSSAFGYFTFVPLRGTVQNAWGFGFYSPATIFGANGISAGAFRAVLADNDSVQRHGGRGSRPSGIGGSTGEGDGSVPNPTLSSEARHAFSGAASDLAAGHRTRSDDGGYRRGTVTDNAGSFGNRNANEGFNTFGGNGGAGPSQVGGGHAGGGGGNMSGGGNGGGNSGGGGGGDHGGGARPQQQQ